MKLLKIKKQTSVFVVILALTFAVSLVITPNAFAHSPAWSIPTWTYLSVSPNPVGTGQPVLLVMWLNVYPPTANGIYGDRWQNYKVTVTKPDGTKEILGPFSSDPVGSAYTMYTPNQVGTYTFVANFPGQTLTGANPNPAGYPAGSSYTDFIGDNYQPSTSNTKTLTVQQARLTEWESPPVPTGFWTRPIYNENRNWNVLASNWLGGSHILANFQPYGQAPNTAHILWTRPITFGGLVSEEFGDISYYDGLSYEGKFPSPVIIQGILYYNEYPTPRYPIDRYPPGFYAVDLTTGKVVFWKNDTISFGETKDRETGNEHGITPILWKSSSGTWQAFDPFNGNDLVTITGVPSGTTVTDKDGTILIYQVGPQNKWLACWNSTKAIMWEAINSGSNYYWNFRLKFGSRINGTNGYQWNVTLPSQLPSDSYVMDVTQNGEIMLFTNGLATGPSGVGIGLTPPTYVQCGISLKGNSPGTLVWTKTRNAAPGNVTITYGGNGGGIYVMRSKETMQWYAYDTTTGAELWGPTTPQADWNMYGMSANIADGKLFSTGYAGILYCYDISNGKLLWNYTSGSGGFDIPYENYPLSIGAIADGKIYLFSTEHSPSKPMWRGSSLRAVDVSTGKELWKIDHWANGVLVADGKLVSLNLYDNQIYTYGKGQTATTVTATPGIGNVITVQGSVTDQSPGRTSLGIPAAGTPAIADEDMSAWMEYLYMQQSKPADAKGVKVRLTAIDPNGNLQDLGTTTSDDNGFFSLMWKPPVPGKYVVTASFEGSESYYGSSAKTAFSAAETATAPIVAPTATVAPTTPPVQPTQTPVQTPSASPTQAVTPPTSAEPSATYIAIGAAVIVIVAIAAVLILKRRK